MLSFQLNARGALGRILYTTGASVFIQLVTLGSGIALARGLEPTGRGELAIAMQWPLIIVGLASLSIPDAVAYFSAHADRDGSRVLPNALALGALQSLAAMVVGFFLIPVLLSGYPGSVVQGALVYLLVIPLHPLVLYPNGVLQGAHDLRAFNIVRAIPHVGYTIALFALWATGQLSVLSALLASFIATLVTAVVCLTLVLRLRNAVVWTFDTRAQLTLLQFGWKVHVGQMAGIVAARADVVALSLLSSATIVGLYVAANTVGAAVAIVPTSLALVLFPAFARLEPGALPGAVARLAWVGLVFLCAALALILGILPQLMVLMFGDSFKAAEGVARIAGMAAAVRGCSVVLASALRGTGNPLQSSLSDVLATGVFVLLLVLLVPLFGAEGAAGAALLSAVVGCSVLVGYLFRSTSLTIRDVARVARKDVTRLLSSQMRSELGTLMAGLRAR